MKHELAELRRWSRWWKWGLAGLLIFVGVVLLYPWLSLPEKATAGAPAAELPGSPVEAAGPEAPLEASPDVSLETEPQPVPEEGQDLKKKDPLPLEETQSGQDQFLNRRTISAILAALLIPVAWTLAWRGWWRYRAQLFLERHAVTDRPEIERVAVRGLLDEILPSLSLLKTAQSFRRRRETPSTQLDLPATVEATARHAGWLTPVPATLQVMPEYLVLVDRATFQDQQAGLVTQLVAGLKSHAALLTHYYFDNDPRICYPAADGKPVSLWQLASEHPNHRLLVFSDSTGLFNDSTGELEHWVDQLLRFHERALLTPGSSSPSAYRASILRRHFAVLPATSAGLSAWMDSLLGVSSPMSATGEGTPLPLELVEHPRRWLDRDEPERRQVERMLKGLEAYLGEAGFYWLSACAVYPAMHLNLTAYLGSKLCDDSGEKLLDPRRLADLTHLPWFRRGFMPDWLRLALISRLSKEQERVVRSVLEDLLLSALHNTPGDFGLEIARSSGNSTSRLTRAVLSLLLSRSEAGAGPLKDHVFLSFMSGRRTETLAVRVPEAIRGLLGLKKARGSWPRRTFAPRRLVWQASMILFVFAVALLQDGTGTKKIQRRALLIGINDYSASKFIASQPTSDLGPAHERSKWGNLEGAVNDVEAMRDMLVGAYGFARQDVYILRDQDATREAILRAIEEHLIKPSQEGDVAIFHFSGMGSYVFNSNSKERDKINETIVPADSRVGAPDILDIELQRSFNRVLDKKARLVVMLDSCYSGSGVFALGPSDRTRFLQGSDLRTVSDERAYGPPIVQRGAIVLAATQKDEVAMEVRDEFDRPYGAFTLAFLRALRSADIEESAENVFQRTLAWLGATGHFQRPTIEGLPERRAEPLFGGRTDHRDSPPAFAAEPYSDGKVRLFGGWINGLAVGSELRRFATQDDDHLLLRVTQLVGLTESLAEILPQGRTISRGDLFELASWVDSDLGPLRVWMPSTTDLENSRRLARELKAQADNGKFEWVEDPTEARAFHVLRWSGDNFELLSAEMQISLGVEPSASKIIRLLPKDSRLFVQIPSPTALADKIEIGPDARDTAEEAIDDPLRATYHLTGRLWDNTVEYAWVRPGATSVDSPSSLPARSSWHPFSPTKPEDVDNLAWALEDILHRLHKVYSWRLLQSPPQSREAFPYRLAVTDSDGNLVDNTLLSDRTYYLSLRTENSLTMPAAYVEDRHVYIFAIDASGSGTLVYPQLMMSENIYPGSLASGGDAPGRINLGEDSAFSVTEPFGYITFFLLSSAESIVDPYVLQWPGINNMGSGLRTGHRGVRPMPEQSGWSIEMVTFETRP